MKIVGAYCAFYDIAADMCHEGRGIGMEESGEKRSARMPRTREERKRKEENTRRRGNNARAVVSRAGGANSRFDFNFNAGKHKALSEKRSFLFSPSFLCFFLSSLCCSWIGG